MWEKKILGTKFYKKKLKIKFGRQNILKITFGEQKVWKQKIQETEFWEQTFEKQKSKTKLD